MSLYGALYTGVSGLQAQSNKLGVISDNISNVNTVGYKSSQGLFQSLVTGSGGSSGSTPGGVLASRHQLIGQQGLLQATSSPTDIAISGGGMFVVNSLATGAGEVLYTRAGSFTQDSNGNFRNAAGFFLQAWPLDREGRLPGEPGNLNTSSSANLSSLRTVNVQNVTGAAAATTAISLSANLTAAQVAFAGQAVSGAMDTQDTLNFGNAAKTLIVPQAAGTLDRLVRGDQFVATTGAGLSYTYTYGGFTFGRVVTSGAAGDNGVADLGDGEFTLANNSLATNGTNTITMTHAAHGLTTGDVIDLSGVAGAPIDGIPANELNAKHVITVTGVNTYTFTVATTATGTTAAAGGNAMIEDRRLFDDGGNILDAATTTQTFLGITGIAGFTTAALSFKIATNGAGGTKTFTYVTGSPNAAEGQFNNLTNLAEAINSQPGLTARVSGGRLYVGALNADDSVTFTNGSTVGAGGPPVQAGINWINELGLTNISTGTGRFSTLQGLANQANASSGLSATITDPLDASTLSINVDDPLDTINLTDASGNTGSVLSALGFSAPRAGAAFVAQTTGDVGPSYDPSDPTKNMASGAITAHFSRPIRIFDSLGEGHDIVVSFLKLSPNKWGIEIIADPTEITTGSAEGLIASGTVKFNGDGTLNSVTSGLTNALGIGWQNLSQASSITFNWGTAGQPFGTPNAIIGLNDGLGQSFTDDYEVSSVKQNGAEVGTLTGVTIDEDGLIVVSYNNGQTQALYKIPLASFANPDSLSGGTGNVFSETSDSGIVNLRSAGGNGVGTIASSSLEASNVELANQLTDMIVAQRAYQANTKMIQTADQMLENLSQIIR